MGLAAVAAVAADTARAATSRHHLNHRDKVRGIVEELRAEHPRIGEQKLVQLLVDRFEADRTALVTAARFIVSTVQAVAESRERRIAAEPSLSERRQRQEQERVSVKAVAKAIKEKLLLDLVLPHGRLLRYTTGAELAGFGCAYSELAARVGSDCMVGEVLTEGEVRELFNGSLDREGIKA